MDFFILALSPFTVLSLVFFFVLKRLRTIALTYIIHMKDTQILLTSKSPVQTVPPFQVRQGGTQSVQICVSHTLSCPGVWSGSTH